MVEAVGRWLLSVGIMLVSFSTAYAGKCEWKPASNGHVPENALVGGTEPGRAALYVCRVNAHGGVHPGKIVDKHCNISWGGKEELHQTYEVLTNCPGRWAPFQTGWKVGVNLSINGDLSVGPFVGPGQKPDPGNLSQGLVVGKEADGTPLVLCKAKYFPDLMGHPKGAHPGKIVKGNCNFAYGGKEIVWKPSSHIGNGFEYYVAER